MTEQYENKYLADALSTRVARDFAPAVWQSLFAQGHDAVEMHTGTWSVVCAESPWDGRMSHDQVRRALASLAELHGGHLDAGPGSTSFAAFVDPEAALRTALALHRDTAGARLRIGVVAARAGLAQFRAEGAAVSLVVGEPLERAPAVLQRAALGTVQLCAATYGALAGFSPQLDACVVMAEYDRDQLTQVALTPPPARGEFLSTFAGLGLT
ncbi:hypothetical protein LZ009_03665 [Ramlibacter sp. XY19]|uniref:hypothetical protein n=1 Tax=Ramlibacter paludis TaxID=2908000 RepID=UPI0023DB0FE6|nr:hypothetical protein [Ramlibacter paludis]MCG2591869.1 hypothetical protein [Ramlibacter paludis]